MAANKSTDDRDRKGAVKNTQRVAKVQGENRWHKQSNRDRAFYECEEGRRGEN